MANAQNNNSLDTSDFIVTAAFVDEGPTFYRHRPRAQGRSAPIRKRMSHITIEVGSPDVSNKKATEAVQKKEKQEGQKSVTKKAPKTKTTKN